MNWAKVGGGAWAVGVLNDFNPLLPFTTKTGQCLVYSRLSTAALTYAKSLHIHHLNQSF